MRPSTPTLIITVIAFLGAAMFIIAKTSAPGSPTQTLQKIKDGCVQQYGNSQQAADCFLALARRYAGENRRDEYDRIYDNAR